MGVNRTQASGVSVECFIIEILRPLMFDNIRRRQQQADETNCGKKQDLLLTWARRNSPSLQIQTLQLKETKPIQLLRMKQEHTTSRGIDIFIAEPVPGVVKQHSFRASKLTRERLVSCIKRLALHESIVDCRITIFNLH